MENSDFINELDDTEIDKLLKYVPEYSPENFKNIRDKFIKKSKPKRRQFSHKKLALIAAALVVLFSTLVYGNVLDISMIYRIVFGEDSKYVEPYIKPLNSANTAMPVHENSVRSETAAAEEKQGANETQNNSENDNSGVIQSEYEGIVIKLISAINDENSLRIFASMTDTTDDRLNGSIDFASWGLSQGNGGGVSVLDYDQKTKTVTLMITSLGNDHQGSATLMINGLTAGRELLRGLPENNIGMAELLKRHTPNIVSQDEIWKCGGASQTEAGHALFENSRLLKFDELDIQFDNAERFSISNIGFVDGLLHIQAKTMSVPNAIDYPYISVNFVDKNNEAVYNGHIRFDFLSDTKYAYAENVNTPHSEYIEMIYTDVTNPEQLSGLSVTIDLLKSPKVIEGNWEFSFAIPEKVTTEFYVGRDLDINDEKFRIDLVSLSPLGITIHLPGDMSADYKHNDSAYVQYEDGSTVDLNQSSIHTYNGESTLHFGGHIIKIEKVRSIVINCDIIDISQ